MKIFISLILLTVLNIDLFAQCDCEGNVPPPMIIISGVVNNGKLMQYEGMSHLNLLMRYSEGDKLYKNDAETENQYHRKFDYKFVGLNYSYGYKNDLNFDIETGYYIIKVMEDFYSDRVSKSLSHLSLGAKYNFFGGDFVDEFMGLIDFSIPLNKNKIDTNNTLLPLNSSFSLGLGAIYNYYLNEDFNLILKAKYDINFKNNENSKFGNTINASLSVYYKMLRQLGIIGTFSGDIRDKSIYSNNDILSSGGKTLNFALQASYSFEDIPISITAGGGVPIYRNYNGVQSAEAFSLFFNIGYSF